MQAASIVNRRYRVVPRATYMFEDTIFNTTSNSFTDTGVSITPDNGKNLVFARANASAGAEGADNSRLQVTYDGADFGTSLGNSSAQGGHWNAIDMGVMKLIDADGTAEVKIQAASFVDAVRSADVGAQQLLSIPMETMGLVEGVDYWYREESDDTPYLVTSGDEETVATLNFTVSNASDQFVAFFYCETAMNSAGQYSVKYYRDAPSANLTSTNSREAISSDLFHTTPWVHKFGGMDAGANSISVRCRRGTGTSDVLVRRSRMCIINVAALAGAQEQRTPTDFDPRAGEDGAGDVFATMPGFNQIYTPSGLEQTIVLAMMTSETTDVTPPAAVCTYRLRDTTDDVNYAEDFGEAIVGAGNVTFSLGMAVKETSKSTMWRVQIREANDTDNACNFTHGGVMVFGLKFL